MNDLIVKRISVALQLQEAQVRKVLVLRSEGATIPFIARYRKEQTQSLTEISIKQIFELEDQYIKLLARKETIVDAIKEQGKWNDKLAQSIDACWDSNLLESIYQPYKKKRKTKADQAREHGLEGLAKIIMAQRNDPYHSAQSFTNSHVKTIEDALDGAQHIIAEWMNENISLRDRLRRLYEKGAILFSKVIKSKQENAQQFKDYWAYEEPLKRVPSHRLLAVRRGEKEGFLRVSIKVDSEYAIDQICNRYIKSNNAAAEYIENAAKDAWKRLISPSLENEFAKSSKLKADEEAIDVFAKNLSQLLLEAPLGEKSTLAIDPGFRTGCKVVVLDDYGDLLMNTVIYPFQSSVKEQEAEQKILAILKKYPIKAIAIGNGTAGRETESFITKITDGQDIPVYLISEAGASIYSASEIAIEEFPNHDITVRGAVSIGRRLMDPLAELVKIDAKSIGVGQYQHDVQQDLLRNTLESVVVSCVNKVGINVNTASAHLLEHVSGIGKSIAKNIVHHRSQNGPFESRSGLLKVKGLGKKAYEQCAGFLRIKDGQNPLDDSGIHPERYTLVKKIAHDAKVNIAELLNNKESIDQISWNQYVNSEVGLPTLNDIKHELLKPGVDPRGEVQAFSFSKQLKTFDDLFESMEVPGIITNITKFGAFVDIGIKENGLVHISEMVNRFIKDPQEVVHLGQKVMVKIITLDKDRKRIQLSMKQVVQNI